MNYREMLAFHLEKGADLTIATTPVDATDATGFGIMKVQTNGMIDQFMEKPTATEVGNWKSEVKPHHQKTGKEYLASMGIYIFKKEALNLEAVKL